MKPVPFLPPEPGAEVPEHSLASRVEPARYAALAGTTRVQKPYIRSLDTLRTIAALLVVFVHIRVPNSVTQIGFFQHTALAVDFFFVLSGFVIAMNYWEISGFQSVWRYGQSRFARIYPLHFLTLLLFLGIEVLKYFGESKWSLAPTLPAFSQNDLRAFVLNLLLLNAHGFTDRVTFNGPAWSIGAEATCYVLFGVVVLTTTDYKRRIGLILLCVVVAAIFFRDSMTLGVIRGILGFGIGCLWWVVLGSAVQRQRQGEGNGGAANSSAGVSWFCLVLAAGGAVAMVFQLAYPGIHFLSLGVIGLCALNPGNAVNRGLARIGEGWFGQVSYGVYLWHAFIIWISSRILTLVLHYPSTSREGVAFVLCPEWVGNVTLAATFVVTLAVAHLSFKFYENPWRNRLRPARRPR
jgi:peptidoglycan/LPS O-acetylase OafA/YrhL